MKKNFAFGFAIGLVALVAGVLWILKVIPALEAAMEWYTLGYFAVIAAGGIGLVFLFRGLLSKLAAPLKKLNIYFGAALILVAIVALVGELVVEENRLVLPIIAVVVTVALLLGYIAVGGKKWDSGDNEKAGYKNYYERKAEEKRSDEDKDDKSDK